jgi:hypothetical protein
VSGGKRTLGERLKDELRDYAIVATYLYVWLAILLLYKSAILREAGLGFLPFGTAAVKALILGKFALIGKGVGLGSRRSTRTLLGQIIARSFLFVVLLVALTVVEEFVVGAIHGRPFSAVLAEHGAHVALEIAANALVLFVVVGAFIAVLEVSRALGPGVLRRVLLQAPGSRGSSGGS